MSTVSSPSAAHSGCGVRRDCVGIAPSPDRAATPNLRGAARAGVREEGGPAATHGWLSARPAQPALTGWARPVYGGRLSDEFVKELNETE